MLQFLRKRLPNIRHRHRFLLQTIYLSAAVHGVFVLSVMIGVQFFSEYVFVMHKEPVHKDVSIVFIPQKATQTPAKRLVQRRIKQ